MPYIHKTERIVFDMEIQLLAAKVETGGQLAYIIYRLVGLIVKHWGGHFKDYAEAWGAVRLALSELQRRKLQPYEKDRMTENGDVDL